VAADHAIWQDPTPPAATRASSGRVSGAGSRHRPSRGSERGAGRERVETLLGG